MKAMTRHWISLSGTWRAAPLSSNKTHSQVSPDRMPNGCFGAWKQLTLAIVKVLQLLWKRLHLVIMCKRFPGFLLRDLLHNQALKGWCHTWKDPRMRSKTSRSSVFTCSGMKANTMKLIPNRGMRSRVDFASLLNQQNKNKWLSRSNQYQCLLKAAGGWRRMLLNTIFH